MKKALCLSLTILAMLFASVKANAMTYSEGLAQCNKKPMVLLVYANWASGYENYLKIFKELQNELSDKYNFVELDIAQPETANFNATYDIYRQLPYIMTFRNNGKITRYIQRDCASDKACIKNKLKTYTPY